MQNKCKLIAEIGWNHMGNMGLAEKMISEATKSGADYCKFQTWKVKNLKDGPWNSDGRLEIYNKAELSSENHKKLFELCEKFKIKFLKSVFNINDLEFLSELSSEAIKIPSHEVYNLELIKAACKKFKKVFISVGACKWSEFENILELDIDLKKVFFMHCVSSYPLEDKGANLAIIQLLHEVHGGPVGYSDHTIGAEMPIYAIAAGACMIEKHFTLDITAEGPDHSMSADPSTLSKLVTKAKWIQEVIGQKEMKVREAEEGAISYRRPS